MPTYKAWIPVVGERLSFSIFGESDAPSPSICCSVADSSHRHILVYQKRFLSDQPFPFPVTDDIKNILLRLGKKDGMHWFLCSASVPCGSQDLDSSLKGRVYIYSIRDIWRNRIEDSVKKAQEKLASYNPESHGCMDDYVNREVEPQLINAKSDFLYCVEFVIERSGVTTIDNQTGKHCEPTGRLYEEYRNYLLSDSALEVEMVHQSYFFLKDLAHTHQHHHPRTDTITVVHEFTKSDLDWIIPTLRNMYRKVLEYKRNPNKGDGTYYASLGVMAYTQSLLNISKDMLSEEEYKKLPVRNHVNIGQSIQASEQILNDTKERTRSFWGAFINTQIALAALLIAIASLASLIGDNDLSISIENTYITTILRWIVNQPVIFFSASILLSYAYTVFSGHHHWRSRAISDILRMLQPHSYRFAVFVLLSASVLALLVTYYLYNLI